MASKLQSVKMLSLLMLVGFILPLVLSLVGCAKAPEAVITEVAELNSRHMPLAYMNSGGKIVWISETANGNALYLYSDGDVRKITSDDSKYHSWPQINDSGQIIWVVLNEEGRGYDLHVYKDGVTTEIVGTDDTYLVPRQNSSGTVVWHQLIKEETGGRFGIFSFNDGTTTQITNSYQHGYVFPQISDGDKIIWFGTDDNGDLHIYSYENGTIAQISDVSLKHLSVSELAEEGVQFDGNINSTGHMVWAGKEEHADSPTQIYLNENGTTTRFTNSQSSCNHPEIADNNHVVWQETEVDSYGNVDTEVVYYHDGVISRITDNDTRDESPSINSRGDIIWQHHDGNDYEIFLRDGKNGKIVQVTNNSIDDVHPKISSEGKVLWVTREYQAGWIYRGIYTASARAFLDTKVNIEGASTQLRNTPGNASLASFQGSSMPWKAHASATGTENLEALPSTLAASDSDPLYTFSFLGDSRGRNADWVLGFLDYTLCTNRSWMENFADELKQREDEIDSLFYLGDASFYTDTPFGHYNIPDWLSYMSPAADASLTTGESGKIPMFGAAGNHDLWNSIFVPERRFQDLWRNEYFTNWKSVDTSNGLVLGRYQLSGPPNSDYDGLCYSLYDPITDALFVVLDAWFVNKNFYFNDEFMIPAIWGDGFVDDTQLDWLEGFLKNNPNAKNAKYKFAFSHSPAFNVEKHFSSNNHPNWTRLWTILADNEFDMYGGAHIHLYTKKLIETDPFDEHPYSNPVYQIISGGGGAELDSAGSVKANMKEWDVHLEQTYVTVSLYPEEIQVTVYKSNDYSGDTGFTELETFEIPK